MHFNDYETAVNYLVHEMPKTDRAVFDDNATISKNHRIMELLGNPQNKHKTVHVAATSGKGTICYFIDAILHAHSKKTGMTQSPHVYDLRERIQINGELISKNTFVQISNELLDTLENTDIVISYFEAIIAMAFLSFSKTKLDYVLLETGMGGRLDATNVVSNSNKICVLGQIGLDHTEVLGNSLAEIATEKAGIVQTGSYVIALHQDSSVNKVFEDRCKAIGASLHWVESVGNYQRTNEQLALTVCQVLADQDNWKIDLVKAKNVLEQVFIPGRFEKREYEKHLLILDGAHNPQKLEAFAGRVEDEIKSPVTVVLSLGKNKNINDCLQALLPITRRVIATEYFTKEQDIPVIPMSSDEIISKCSELGIEAQKADSPMSALQKAASYTESIGITGSFYLISEIGKDLGL